ncbi:hypothetical protein I4J10_10255 [Corynebacterium diphtheriae bv. mitis]|uniref:hypothetical protein n=1 Tax=Corynebacterium diphtheriae TaxID=1717 RepID=UPI0013C56BFA|nr:hypothetical protein [Corynebacterium diphtheriae]MBG9277540.1 hypothetical protein [Corynebacterium diphtheriae bv. mitis]MBG9282023.1 hypothetical protein [Corynebacterium diphtheriae bv. mitis]CAB0922605.1 hypothetical protein FRC0425_02502 [Corynebacterium diphtheriae]
MNKTIHTGIASFPTITITPAGEVKLHGGSIYGDVHLTVEKTRRFINAMNQALDEAGRYPSDRIYDMLRQNPEHAYDMLTRDIRKGIRRAARGKVPSRQTEWELDRVGITKRMELTDFGWTLYRALDPKKREP